MGFRSLSYPTFCAVVFATACTTMQRPVVREPITTAQPVEKAGTKDAAALTAPVPTVPSAVPPPTVVNNDPLTPAPAAAKPYTQDDLTRFIKAQSTDGVAFGPAEHELVGSLPSNPQPGSLEEAALALGLVKAALHPLGKEDQTFTETDLSKDPAAHTVPVAPSTLALENLAKERQINIADALVENPMLHAYGIAKQVFQAVSKPGTTPAYRAEIVSALKNQASQWQTLSSDLDQPAEGDAGVPPVAAVTADAPAPVPAAANDAGQAPPDPADLHASDSVLGEAQALSDRGDYKGAIKKAQSVDKDSPLYGAAQDKVKDFSNRAVQDLRKRAAQAFQSAMPITDKKARSQYLQQAKTYLEEALTNYPQATQLPIVRDNLRVISKDLDRLSAEK